MVTLYKAGTPSGDTEKLPYTRKRNVDTRIPPRAKPVFGDVSVNGVAIKESDILAEAQNHPAKNPGEALVQAARALVVRELLWQKAQRLGLASADNGENASGLTVQTPVDAAIGRLIEQEIRVPSATREECRRIYERSPEKFFSDMIVEARHILIAAPPGDRQACAAARKKAMLLIEELLADKSRFGALARDHSACPSAAQGGSLGQLTRGSTVPEFEKALKNAPDQGLIKTPVASRYGFHIIDISRKITGKRLSFEAVHESVAAWLEASSWSKAVSHYIMLLAGEADIKGIDILPHEARGTAS